MTDEPDVQLELATIACVPQGELAGVFVFPGGPPADTRSIEFSVLWKTSGRGTEDLGVVHFQAWKATDNTLDAMPNPHSFSIKLPPTPWSYDGELIKIHWLARIRIRWGEDGSKAELVRDAEFTLAPVSRS